MEKEYELQHLGKPVFHGSSIATKEDPESGVKKVQGSLHHVLEHIEANGPKTVKDAMKAGYSVHPVRNAHGHPHSYDPYHGEKK